MTAPFAAIESRINDAVIERLADVTAVVGGVTVLGFFDAEYQDAFGMVAGQVSSLLVKVSDVAPGTTVTVAGINYTVTESRPENGMSRLMLRRS